MKFICYGLRYVFPVKPLELTREFQPRCLKPDFEIRTPERAGSDKLVMECFPADAVRAANRLGWFGGDSSAEQIKSYKKQKGKLLNESQVVELVKKVLGPF